MTSPSTDEREAIEVLLTVIEKQGDKAYAEGHYTIGIRIREATAKLRSLLLTQ